MRAIRPLWRIVNLAQILTPEASPRLLKVARHLVERAIELSPDRGDGGKHGQAHQRAEQSIFDRGRAGLVREK
jgi:hypothetical protein